MNSILHRPTLLVGIGPFGRDVLARLDEDAGALDAKDRARFGTLRLPTQGEQDAAASLNGFASALTDHLERMLRAGTEHTQELDLAIVGDLSEVSGELLIWIAGSISSVLADRFSVLFPPTAAPDQRTVWLNVILAAPAITDNEAGRRALGACVQLERWHRGTPPSPCLSRIWLAPRQTAGGVLTDEDVQRSVFLFAAAAYLSGLRHTDPVRTRLGVPRSGRVLGTFAVAAAEVPVGRLSEYCAWRTALIGLDALVELADDHRPAGNAVREAIDPLQVDGWLAPFEEGREAASLRQRALANPTRAQLRPLELKPPGLAEKGSDVLARHAELLEDPQAARVPAPAEADPLLRDVDGAEARLVETSLKVADDFIIRRLAPENGLRELALVSESLGSMAGILEETVQASRTDPLRPAEAPPAVSKVAAAALRNAAGRKQGALPVALAAIPLTGVLAVALAALTAATGSPVVGDPAVKVLGPGTALGLVVGGAWALGTLFLAHRALRRAIADRTQEIAETLAERTPGGPTRPAELSLDVRRLRMARTLSGALRARQTRVQSIRSALEAARERARTELHGLRVVPGATPHQDDTTNLLPPQTPLHWQLFQPAVIPELCVRTGPRDLTVWPVRLLQAAWPKDGFETDLPFADARVWFQLAHAQHEELQQKSPFTWPDVDGSLEKRVVAFLKTAPRSLSFGVRSLREDNVRESSNDETELLVLAPADAGTVLAQAQRAEGVPPLTECRTLSASPRVVVLRTASEIDSTGAWRGLQ